jgi:hypothetical protein
MTIDDAQTRTDAVETVETKDGEDYPTGMLASPTRIQL